MNTLFGISDIFKLYHECVNGPYSPFGGNYEVHSVKNGENPSDKKSK